MSFEYYVIIVSVIVLLLIILRVFASSRYTYGELKGIEGEKKVSDILKKENIRYFTDVLLELGRTSTQIDHLVIFPNKTVMVIETKNKDGIIAGNYNDHNWSQTFPNTNYTFYSPIKQNEGHIRFLERFCEQHNLKGYHFVNVVVFASERCDIRNTPSNVIHYKELSRYMKRYKKKKLFNASGKFTKTIKYYDQSKNKRKVKQHLSFIQEAKKHNKG